MKRGVSKKAVMRKSLTVFHGVCLTASVWLVFGLPALCWSLELLLPERAYQGDIFVGRIKPPATVFSDGKALSVSPEGYFVIGISSR